MARAKIVQQKLQKLFETVCVTRNIQTGQKTKSESSSLHLGLEIEEQPNIARFCP